MYGANWEHYAQIIYDSIHPTIRNIMDDGQFSPTEFLDPSKGVRQMTQS